MPANGGPPRNNVSRTGTGALLCLFALGTNMGIKAIVATGEHGESEAARRRVGRSSGWTCAARPRSSSPP